MKNLSIKIKLVLLFILLKVIPLLILAYIAVQGVLLLEDYFSKNTKTLFDANKKIIESTANLAIEDSIKMLDKKSQISLEKFSYQIAQNVAAFLYERDSDLLFLANSDIKQSLLENFYQSKSKTITLHEKYIYFSGLGEWKSTHVHTKKIDEQINPSLKDNNNEFHYTNPYQLKTKKIPIYKEITYFDLNGKEHYKVSQLSPQLLDISQKTNTYVNAENYFKQIDKLKKGEIFVSEVIGEYRPSKIIGTFSREKSEKAGIPFEPMNHAYAGKENPVGKPFEGIIRFITPVFKNGKKTGFISLALDHRHIMEFTDTVNPTKPNIKQAIADASVGNYAFMWDYKGQSISHPRDYFIVGYDAKTGQKVLPWISADIQKKFEASKEKDLRKFIKNYPVFEEQSLNKKPNLPQLKESGNIALDCRYLNFAPQCKGWMEVTQDGGYGSFVIYWSKVWKLTTAATIPYYTGQYGSTKRGFGFVTIGANVDEFHSAAIKTKENVDNILKQQTHSLEQSLKENNKNIIAYIESIIQELTIVTVIMVLLVLFIAIWLSNILTKKLQNLLVGTQKFANNEFDFQIEVSSNDEIGQLEDSFNAMTQKISKLIFEQQELNKSLESKVKNAIVKTEQNERIIRQKDNILAQQAKMAAMGEMLENIAHQWRQPLSVISTASSGLKMKQKLNRLKEEDIDKSVDNIMNSTRYLSDTIDDFRNFFDSNKERKIFNLQESVEKAINILSSKFTNSEITIIKELEPVEIVGIENELIQVVMNLLNNAKDELILKEIAPKLVFINLHKKNNEITLQIKDNALGIDEAIIDRIFEPYFTTKHQAQGTGIGLHMSREIIVKHMGGTISAGNHDFIYNEQKLKGAEFTIKIPLDLPYASI